MNIGTTLAATKSVINEHRIVEHNHDVDWNVLDKEKDYNKRLISGVIFIKKQRNGLNLQNDTNLLNPLYHESFLVLNSNIY